MSDAEVTGAAMRTPWGSVDELRERRLHPSNSMTREEVARNQRERLFGAIVATVAEKGYEASTVADALELSGVSRSAFYEHFANRGECLVAAAEALMEPTLAALGNVAELGGSPETVFHQFLRLVENEPAAARVCFIELHAAGEAGEAVADRAIEALARHGR